MSFLRALLALQTPTLSRRHKTLKIRETRHFFRHLFVCEGRGLCGRRSSEKVRPDHAHNRMQSLLIDSYLIWSLMEPRSATARTAAYTCKATLYHPRPPLPPPTSYCSLSQLVVRHLTSYPATTNTSCHGRYSRAGPPLHRWTGIPHLRPGGDRVDCTFCSSRSEWPVS